MRRRARRCHPVPQSVSYLRAGVRPRGLSQRIARGHGDGPAKQSAGISQQVKDGLNGYLVSTPKEMANRILALQKNTQQRKKMGRAGQAIAQKHFSLEKMVESYARLIAELVAQEWSQENTTLAGVSNGGNAGCRMNRHARRFDRRARVGNRKI